jgi:hypothetical protein
VLTAQIKAKSEGIVFVVEKWKQISVIAQLEVGFAKVTINCDAIKKRTRCH